MFTVYKTTCLINNKIYIGVHKTEKINDKYLGSGSVMKKAIAKYGRENFLKEILFVFDNEEEAYLKESELVNLEFINRNDNYNLFLGGLKGKSSVGTIPVKDQQGNNFRLYKNDPRILNGEVIHNCKGTCSVFDENGQVIRVTTQERLKRDLKGISTGKSLAFSKILQRHVMVKAADPRFSSDDLIWASTWRKDTKGGTDEYLLSCERISKGKIGKSPTITDKRIAADRRRIGTVIVVDKDGKKFMTQLDDPKFLNGELKHIRKGQSLPLEFFEKIAKSIYTLKTPDGLIVETKNMKGFAKQYDFVPMFKVGRKTLSGWSLIGKRSAK